MKISIRMFAAARDAVGADQSEIELPDNATVGQLRTAMADQLPTIATLLPNCMIAIDEEYAADDAMVTKGATVACIPPLSGG